MGGGVVLGLLGPRTGEALERLRRVVLQYAMVPRPIEFVRDSFSARWTGGRLGARSNRKIAAPVAKRLARWWR